LSTFFGVKYLLTGLSTFKTLIKILTDADDISDGQLLQRIASCFGLSQIALGRLLGLSPSLVSHILAGRRLLPLSASVLVARLKLAYSKVEEAAPVPVEAPDAATLRLQQQRCHAYALGLGVKLTAMEGRATWAQQRLAALPILQASLPDGPVPTWLASFEGEAREVLAANGSTAQALVKLRQAALEYEAARAGEQ
jgi:transcriptional regulator with XRE-family HTH domain